MHPPDDFETFFRGVADHLVSTGVATATEIQGHSDAVIDQLQVEVGLPFPAAYRAFLRVLGGGAGAFLIGTDIFGNLVVDLREWARELLDECGAGHTLPDDALVFMMHQGYQYWYMRTLDGSSNPPVRYFYEVDAQERQFAASFTEHIAALARAWGERHRGGDADAPGS